ncbi:MAG: DUF4255 domain-containing protein [Leptolyngbyaceae cyanobacterium MO_188.B28]|nr:DUF4255 domain-containing protein [Leptolyngbyaceae cyanobacterium MO_188.B28]
MILDALKLIQNNLQNYIIEVEGLPDIIVLNNIAMAEELGGSNIHMNGRIVISLVNLQEESTLKNTANYRVKNGQAVYQNPPTSLNLFILFSVLDNQYENALRLLSRVIEFFQWRRLLSPSLTPGNMENLENSKDFEICMDLYSLTFEQLNHLWGALGGKQVPFALYRARLVAVDAQKRQAEGPVITEIDR